MKRGFSRFCTLRAVISGVGLCVLALGVGAAEPTVRAQLAPRRIALLSAELAAKIQRLPISEGGAFAAGDPLVVFEDSLPRAQLERAEAVLAAAEKTVAANQRLLALKSIGQLELELSVAELAKARSERALASAMLAKCTIVAPFSGRVSEQRAREQEFAQPGQPIVEVIDDSVPEIDFIAPSKWLGFIKPGQRLQLQLDETGRTYAAVVERIGAKADAVSQSVKIVAAFAEAPTDVVAGMSGSITLPPSTTP